MLDTMPQEIEVRYILPAIRREFARIFVKEHELSQKEAARILGLTEAAISQYQHSKRAKEAIFTEKIIDEIRQSAKKIINGKNTRQSLIAEMYRISSLTNVRQILCDIHRSQSKELAKCNICFEDNNVLTVKTK